MVQTFDNSATVVDTESDTGLLCESGSVFTLWASNAQIKQDMLKDTEHTWDTPDGRPVQTGFP